VELADDGLTLPFSRGCSFITVNNAGQITYARDLVEAPSKPGDAGLTAIAAIAPVIRAARPDMDKLPMLPPSDALALWAFYAGAVRAGWAEEQV
jgi:hypothetical protein